AALRAVGYWTQYGGFIDALTPGGAIRQDVNSGEREGGRIALTIKPTDNITITPPVGSQRIDMDAFNREEVCNLFANALMTPPNPVGERQQFLRLGEEFKDEMTLADLTATIGFQNFDLTSVSSYIERNILVSRDASALTDSVSIDLAFNPA